MSPPRATRAALLLVVAAACASPEPFREGVRLSEQLLPSAVTSDRGPYLTRIVDDLTGEPVAGAEVLLVAESTTPIAGEFWFTHRGVSDAAGFVRIRQPNGNRDWHLQVLRHPRYGTVARSGGWMGLWRLGTAFDVPVRITDWLGRPAAGARIGFCGACGHSPDLVNATADGNGVAVLRRIDPHQDIADLYVQHPGLHFFYNSVEWYPGDGPRPVQCVQGPAQTGRVVDHRGQPVAGAYVCGGDRHRGPWARTAADGSFTVLGADPESTPHRVRTPAGRDVYFPSAGSYPVTMQLPDLTDPEVYQGTIDVPRRAAMTAVATRMVGVHVHDAPTAQLSFSASYLPCPERRRQEPGRVEVPTTGPFVLYVHDDRSRVRHLREFVFAGAADLPDPLVVRWTPDVPVVGRVVDAQGRPRAARVRFRDRWSDDAEDAQAGWLACPDGSFRLTSDWPSMKLLELQDAGGTLRPRMFWIRVPVPGAAERLELGDLRLASSPQLRVLGDDGLPLRAGLASFARAGWQQAGEYRPWRLDDDGAWRGPDLLAGDAVLVQRDAEAVPFRTRLQGDGPWTIVAPSGQLTLDIVDPQGERLDAVVGFADQECRAKAVALTLRGLPQGPLRFYVGAPGHQSAVVDVRITASPRSMRVELPRREG